MGAKEIEAFLTHLAVDGNVAASTQNQALSALLFLYHEVLHIDLPESINAVRAKKPARLPVVLTRAETQQVIAGMSGLYQLMAKLLYGSGLRLMECVRLRVKDLDFERCEIIVVTVQPVNQCESLRTLRVLKALKGSLFRGMGGSSRIFSLPNPCVLCVLSVFSILSILSDAH